VNKEKEKDKDENGYSYLLKEYLHNDVNYFLLHQGYGVTT